MPPLSSDELRLAKPSPTAPYPSMPPSLAAPRRAATARRRYCALLPPLAPDKEVGVPVRPRCSIRAPKRAFFALRMQPHLHCDLASDIQEPPLENQVPHYLSLPNNTLGRLIGGN